MKTLLLLSVMSASTLFGQAVTLTAVMNPLIGVRMYQSAAAARAGAPLEINMAASLMCKSGCPEMISATLYGTLLVVRDADPNTTHFEVTYTIGEATATLLVRKVDTITQYPVWVPGASNFKVLPLKPSAPLMEAN